MKSDWRLALTERACQYSAAIAWLAEQSLEPVQLLLVNTPVSAEQADWLVDYDAEGVLVHCLAQPNWKPLRWRFTEAVLLRRLQQASRHQEVLLKMMGKNLAKTELVDATGGRGWDALLLAKAGASVTVCERDPLIFALLQEAKHQASSHPLLAKCLERTQWVFTDANVYLPRVQVDIVYCDPMFPPRTHRALNQKNLLALQQLVGHGDLVQLSHLIHTAQQCAKSRVVLKYAAHAKLPADLCADFSSEGRGHHWYVFLQNNKRLL